MAAVQMALHVPRREDALLKTSPSPACMSPWPALLRASHLIIPGLNSFWETVDSSAGHPHDGAAHSHVTSSHQMPCQHNCYTAVSSQLLSPTSSHQPTLAPAMLPSRGTLRGCPITPVSQSGQAPQLIFIKTSALLTPPIIGLMGTRIRMVTGHAATVARPTCFTFHNASPLHSD